MDANLTIISLWLCLSATASGATPTASELLDEYAATQGKHDYNIAKAHVQLLQGEGHFFYSKPFETAGKKLDFTMENVRFKNIDGIWLAVEADMRKISGIIVTVPANMRAAGMPAARSQSRPRTPNTPRTSSRRRR